MKQLTFWTPHENTSNPDLVYRNGEEVTDENERISINQEISRRVQYYKSFQTPGTPHTLFCRYPYFVIDIVPSHRYEPNRITGIFVMGEFPKIRSRGWVNEVSNEITDFVTNTCNRELTATELEDIRIMLITTDTDAGHKSFMPKLSTEETLAIISVIPLPVGFALAWFLVYYVNH